ncbi:hypothetical protein J6590_024233 [Homalodisca vitripennis]|nr:hypothetical protein J6590_024233 [Homalodisca vitripennis]
MVSTRTFLSCDDRMFRKSYPKTLEGSDSEREDVGEGVERGRKRQFISCELTTAFDDSAIVVI